jgi:hypothetical protein
MSARQERVLIVGVGGCSATMAWACMWHERYHQRLRRRWSSCRDGALDVIFGCPLPACHSCGCDSPAGSPASFIASIGGWVGGLPLRRRFLRTGDLFGTLAAAEPSACCRTSPCWSRTNASSSPRAFPGVAPRRIVSARL